MWVVYVLLFFSMYTLHCVMAKNLVEYYTAQPRRFHWNLLRWNQDVQFLVDSLV